MNFKKDRVWGYFLALSDRQLMPTAIKVSSIVGIAVEIKVRTCSIGKMVKY
ncbi:MAG: hypothetical protein ACFBSE_03520 [Prochloraceae cyanobacterium]